MDTSQLQEKDDHRGPKTHSNTGTLSKFKILAQTSTIGYRMLADFEKNHPGLNLTAKPNLKGEWILTPKDQETYNKIKTTKLMITQELSSTDKHLKAVVVSYPLALPLEPLLKQENIVAAERMKNKYGQLTTAILTTFIGAVPERISLGIWGTFRTTQYNQEPLRCYRCQRFGHHRNQCTTEVRCAVCAGRHDTQTCLDKHKQGQETTAKCPNCLGKHHAWYSRCPARLNKIKQQRPNQELRTPQPRRTLLPTPINNPWTNKQQQPGPSAFNAREFPPLVTQQQRLETTKPQRQKPQKVKKQLMQQKQEQPQKQKETEHSTSAQKQRETELSTQTPTKEAEPTITLTKQDLREIMANFVATLLNALDKDLPVQRIELSLDKLVNSAEKRSRLRHTPPTQSPKDTTPPNTNPVEVMEFLSPIQTPEAHKPHNNPRDPRVRARTHSR